VAALTFEKDMRYLSRKVVLVVAGIAIGAMLAAAQAPAQKPSFEVASVKPNVQSGFSRSTMSIAGNRYTATGTTVWRLIMEAYNLRDWQVTGGPSWINKDQWDVEAVADDGVPLLFFDVEDPSRPTAASLMMQSLIEDRFQFKFHGETKELPVYELTVARSGPKFRLSMEQQSLGSHRIGRGEIDQQAEPLATFAYLLSRWLDRTLINKVDLSGLYDIKLQWDPTLKVEGEPLPASDRPSVFTAVQEQLGLNLKSSKGQLKFS
jgi:bla regulator protein blaR1